MAFSFHFMDTSSRWAIHYFLQPKQLRITVIMDLIYPWHFSMNTNSDFICLIGIRVIVFPWFQIRIKTSGKVSILALIGSVFAEKSTMTLHLGKAQRENFWALSLRSGPFAWRLFRGEFQTTHLTNGLSCLWKNSGKWLNCGKYIFLSKQHRTKYAKYVLHQGSALTERGFFPHNYF